MERRITKTRDTHRMSIDDSFKRLEREERVNKRIAERIDWHNLAAANINDYIAVWTDIERAPTATPEGKKDMANRVTIYSYLRDTHAAQTVGDAWNCLAERKVANEVVLAWITNRKIHADTELIDATKKGYPQYAGMIEKHQPRTMRYPDHL